MKIGKNGIDLIKQWEGLVLYAYDDQDTSTPRKRVKRYEDVKGVLTWGYGHTSAAGFPAVVLDREITEKEAEETLVRDLAVFERNVNRLVKVELTQNQFDALVSFEFNTGALGKSTLLKKLNKGDYDGAQLEFSRWVFDDGKKVKGLVNRRMQEAALFGKGEFVSSNYVTAEPEKPKILTKENVTIAATVSSSVLSGTGVAEGSGAVQIALAIIMVGGAAILGFIFLRKHLKGGK